MSPIFITLTMHNGVKFRMNVAFLSDYWTAKHGEHFIYNSARKDPVTRVEENSAEIDGLIIRAKWLENIRLWKAQQRASTHAEIEL